MAIAFPKLDKAPSSYGAATIEATVKKWCCTDYSQIKPPWDWNAYKDAVSKAGYTMDDVYYTLFVQPTQGQTNQSAYIGLHDYLRDPENVVSVDDVAKQQQKKGGDTGSLPLYKNIWFWVIVLALTMIVLRLTVFKK